METKKPAESEKSAPHFRIFLRGIRFYCRIGIDAAEREVRQKLLTDVEITPIAPSESPALPAVDYAAVLRRLRVFAESKQHDLMENFAEEAADIILNEFAAAEVRVCCCKPEPFPDLSAAAAEVRKSRESPE